MGVLLMYAAVTSYLKLLAAVFDSCFQRRSRVQNTYHNDSPVPRCTLHPQVVPERYRDVIYSGVDERWLCRLPDRAQAQISASVAFLVRGYRSWDAW